MPDATPPEPDVGVGPWQGEWPDDDRLDPELLTRGDRRNVVDRYRYWRHDAIVADLDTSRHGFHVAIENWQHDLNIGSVVRTANAFNAAAVHIVGRRRWNRRGAMVTDRYQHVLHHPDVAGLLAWAARQEPVSSGHRGGTGRSGQHGRPGGGGRTSGSGLPVIGIDNLPGAVPLEGYGLPRECVLLFGQEGPGLTRAAHEGCDVVLSIAQFGSTRSLNAGAAAAIAMHTWVVQYAV
ncbi:MAG TPA: TrmH family RNA methyltransferase [Actinomycetales bacterium]|nr:TrmH family RNA methyltransferase [Actinomycetales bacterium]